MTPKKRAIHLTDSFKDYVNPYVGSGMLSNWYDNEGVLRQSQNCAMEAVKLAQIACPVSEIGYWENVEAEIKNVTIDDLQLPVETKQ